MRNGEVFNRVVDLVDVGGAQLVVLFQIALNFAGGGRIEAFAAGRFDLRQKEKEKEKEKEWEY